ncbi:MAG: hypothetical protein WD689_10065 [Gaiellaceae bacterium]
MTGVLLAGAIVLLVVALAGGAFDAFSDGTVDAIALAGLALLAVGQGLRAWRDRSTRTVLILVGILALIAFVLID